MEHSSVPCRDATFRLEAHPHDLGDAHPLRRCMVQSNQDYQAKIACVIDSRIGTNLQVIPVNASMEEGAIHVEGSPLEPPQLPVSA